MCKYELKMCAADSALYSHANCLCSAMLSILYVTDSVSDPNWELVPKQKWKCVSCSYQNCTMLIAHVKNIAGLCHSMGL